MIYMRKEIITAGSGWIFSGVVCISTWAIEFSRAAIGSFGLLYIGFIVIIIGASLFAFNKKLESTIRRLEMNAHKKA